MVCSGFQQFFSLPTHSEPLIQAVLTPLSWPQPCPNKLQQGFCGCRFINTSSPSKQGSLGNYQWIMNLAQCHPSGTRLAALWGSLPQQLPWTEVSPAALLPQSSGSLTLGWQHYQILGTPGIPSKHTKTWHFHSCQEKHCSWTNVFKIRISLWSQVHSEELIKRSPHLSLVTICLALAYIQILFTFLQKIFITVNFSIFHPIPLKVRVQCCIYRKIRVINS